MLPKQLINLLLQICCVVTMTPAEAVDHSTETTVVTGNYPAVNLFESSVDVLGRPITYPGCEPSFHAVVITMAPYQVGKAHQHLTPLFAYILEGELNVDYQTTPIKTNTYRAGDALMEAMHVAHHGYNSTGEPVKLLAFYMNCAK